MQDLATAYVADVQERLRALKTTAERGAAQVSDADFFAAPDAETNSIAITMKHMAGNLRSRFTDFLTSDGEKPDRHRDGEFVIGPGESRAAIEAQWERGWAVVFDALAALAPGDLLRTVRIRGEPHTVLQAVNRQLAHQAYHVGQIVQLAKHYAGPGWRTLTVPRGASEAFAADMRARYDAGEGGAAKQ